MIVTHLNYELINIFNIIKTKYSKKKFAKKKLTSYLN
jgi:hypothetical protein